MACDCIEVMDAKLAPHNTRLAVTFGFPSSGGPSYTRPTIQTEKVESRKRGSAALALASYCPFCGASYHTEINAEARAAKVKKAAREATILIDERRRAGMGAAR